jgi:hypothetical protein
MLSRTNLLWVAALLVLLLVALPPFVCMELHSDPILFDNYARNLQRGGVLYRDSCEVNLPGMTWLHWGIRSTLGWRSETMRAIDLLVMGSVVVMLAFWIPGMAAGWRYGLAIALAVFYFTLTEWCHVQRDPWMLLPALGALRLRRERRWPFVEGLLWAAAFWIKPYVAVPAVLVWLTSFRLAFREGISVRRFGLDGAKMLVGSVVVALLGIAWLITSGAWPLFLDLARVWSPEYFNFDVTNGEPVKRGAGVLVRFFPWVLIHLIAVPLALRQILRDGSAALPAAFYLGWFIQGLFLQHNVFDYVEAPSVMLGLTFVGGHIATVSSPISRRLFAAFLAACVLFRTPTLIERAECWSRCWSEGSSVALRDKLSFFHQVHWRELRYTAEYLRSRDVHSGELTCFNMPTAALYREMDVEPSTRYHFLQNNWMAFRSQRPRILADLAASRQRFVVVDLMWEGVGLKREKLDDLPLPPRWDRWRSRIVFRAERYAVLEIPAAEMPAWLTECFGD